MSGIKDLEWDFFISHAQASGGDQCRTLQLALVNRGLRVWYDNSANVVTEAGMIAGVRGSKVFLLFLSEGVFARPFVRLEIEEALRLGKPICMVHETDARHGKFDFSVQAVIAGVPDRWHPVTSHLIQSCESLPFRRKDYELNALLSKIEDRLAKSAALVMPVPAVVREALQPLRRQTKVSEDWELPRSGITLEEQVGRGAQADVFKAQWGYRGETRTVAVKRFAAGTSAERAAAAKVLSREVRVLGQLSQHKNVVSLHGVCTVEPGPLLLVMGFAAKGTLAKELETGSLDTKERFRLLQGIAEGLQAVHASRNLHLDIKPSNVLISADGTPWLTDFGIAKDFSTAGATTSTGLTGTTPFMSPERFRGRRQGGPLKTVAADVYSFAVLAWTVMTGDRPWNGEDDMGIREDVMDGLRPQLSSGKDWHDAAGIVETGLAPLIEACWAQDHEVRPAMLAVCNALEDLATARGFPATHRAVLAANANGARVNASNALAAAAAAAAASPASSAVDAEAAHLAAAETLRALHAAEAKIKSMVVPLPVTWTVHAGRLHSHRAPPHQPMTRPTNHYHHQQQHEQSLMI